MHLALAASPETLGALDVELIRPALVQQFLDGLADKPGTQATARAVLKAVEKWAIVRDRLPGSITIGTEVEGCDGGHTPWSPHMIALAEKHAAPELSRAITMASNTGQRGIDLVKMRWTDIETIDGHPGIHVRQQKTGIEIWVPFTAELGCAMVGWPRSLGYILIKADGTPFTRPQLSDHWLDERGRNPALTPLRDPPMVMHGLRGAAVVRLRRLGASIPMICDMVGMSPPMVKRYARFSEQRENAMAAVRLIDQRSASVVKLRRDEG